ncbi:hypothetical protein KA005_47330, partial [bacterium]|nr:hypothetical protein [bacterium]
MAEVIRYVDPDASGGGTGLDWTNAYTSLSAWEVAEQTDLVTDTDWHHVYVRSSSNTADTTTTQITGWTTGVANYILIEAASTDRAEKGSYNTSKYRLEVSGANALDIRENYVRIDGIQIQLTASSVSSISALLITGQDASNDIRIFNCRIKGVLSGTSADVFGVYSSSTLVNLLMWNDITSGFVNGANLTIGVYARHASFSIYNSILYENNVGIRIRDNNGTLINLASFNNTDDVLDSAAGSTIDYCATDDGDGTNSISPLGASWTNEYSDPPNGDFTLLNSGNCYQGGADNPSSGLYTTDMEGDVYNIGAYSVGVDEYV